MSERYGWTWDYIDSMTLYRVLVAYGAFCPEDGEREFSPAEAANIAAQSRMMQRSVRRGI